MLIKQLQQTQDRRESYKNNQNNQYNNLLTYCQCHDLELVAHQLDHHALLQGR